MTDPGVPASHEQPPAVVSGEPYGLYLLRAHGRLVARMALVGLILGVVVAVLTPRGYQSTATFIPQGQETGGSNLELAASTFGVRLPTSGSGWGTAVYVELLNSRALLEPIVLDTLQVPEEGARRAVIDLLDLPDLPRDERVERAIRTLRTKVLAVEEKKLNAVRLTVTTEWPSVSFAIADRLVAGVNRFNVETRKSQATEERRFVDGRVKEAEQASRDAEDRLQAFLQQNRSYEGSAQLRFIHDRLDREVSLRQSMLTSLMQRREEARIKEVRDAPVITVIERPRVPVIGLGRRAVMRAVFGALLTSLLTLGFVLFREGLTSERLDAPDAPEVLRIFRYLRQTFPALVRWVR